MKKRLLGITVSFFCLFGLFFAVAQMDWFGYTKLSFLSGSNEYPSLSWSFVASGATTTGFTVRISNSGDQAVTMKLVFVNQILSSDSENNKVCDMVSGAEFGSNLAWDAGNFSVPASGSVDKRVAFTYNACFSGAVMGCAVQVAANDVNAGSFDVSVGKANFIDFTIQASPNCAEFPIKIFPGSRPSANFSNLGELRFYDTSKQLIASGKITNDSFGSGGFFESVPSGVYYVVYKGQSHLASYLSGINITQGTPFDLNFTTGTNLYNVQNKSLSEDDGYRYQIAGDLKSPISFLYDFVINGNDVSALVYGSGLVPSGVSVLDPKNLNGDVAINGADISIIGINYQITDPFGSSQFFAW